MFRETFLMAGIGTRIMLYITFVLFDIFVKPT